MLADVHLCDLCLADGNFKIANYRYHIDIRMPSVDCCTDCSELVEEQGYDLEPIYSQHGKDWEEALEEQI